ncbi:unnamed protein product [Brassica rapa subsp. narinosa]
MEYVLNFRSYTSGPVPRCGQWHTWIAKDDGIYFSKNGRGGDTSSSILGVGTLKKRGESTMIQGTITAHRLYSFKNLLSEGTVYKLTVFYVARSNNHFKLCASSVCRLVLNVTLGTQFYFYHESQATQYAGSAEQRVVPLVYLPKYGGVKKLESVRLTKLNIYVLNSPLQHHTSDDMSVAVKLSMVPNPVVKSSCSYHTNGPDDVPIIEGCPASTDPEPAHTDSILTST